MYFAKGCLGAESEKRMGELIKILCVDGEWNLSKALNRLFTDEDGYEILVAETGEKGLEILAEETDIRLVVFDYQMSGMNGFEFLTQIYEKHPATILMVLSGSTDTSAVVEKINPGRIYKTLSKPWNDEQLKAAISEALQHQQLQLQNNRLNEELQKKNQQLAEINAKFELLVEQRTEVLEIRNRVLQIAQGVLDALPVAVFGIDPEQMIVHCNDYARDLFPYGGIGPLGNDRQDVFPADLNTLIDRVATEPAPKANLQVHAHRYRAEVRRLDVSLTKGVVLALIPE